MPLVLALKNQNSIVVASDVDALSDGSIGYGQFLNLPGRSILLIAGNLEAVRRPIMETVAPKLTASTSAATLAQLLQAALMLEVAPNLDHIPGRVELIVAGIDPVRHTEEPGLYYLDSASGFALQATLDDYLAAGATAEVQTSLRGRDLQSATTEELLDLAKDCLATAKLRWPAALGAHQQFGIITPTQTRIIGF